MKLSSRERRRLMREAEHEAAESLRVDRTRDFAGERDAWIELELTGAHAQLRAAVKAQMLNPGRRKDRWDVIVGQDDPPDGLWGWAIIEAHKWPAQEIARVPVAFATQDQAREAGETAADALWSQVNRSMGGPG